MNTVFIALAITSLIGATVLFIVRKKKKSDLAGNLCFVFVLVGLLSFGCYTLEVDKLFEKNYCAEYRQVTTSAVTKEQNNGRPVKKEQSCAKTQSQIHDKVYITRNGEKYHFSPTCGGNEYYECTLEQALDRNLSPCKRCAQ
ncbi:MAG: LPXTG cell wall anchor domain-containing protein [Clostridia bacterium]|nr:LPXTG cell wall anchor domain-containing protein [Clostridia bacterium]